MFDEFVEDNSLEKTKDFGSFELPALLWGTKLFKLKVINLKCYKGFN